MGETIHWDRNRRRKPRSYPIAYERVEAGQSYLHLRVENRGAVSHRVIHHRVLIVVVVSPRQTSIYVMCPWDLVVDVFTSTSARIYFIYFQILRN